MTEFKVGQKASVSKTITDADVRDFARISGDDNPIHLDDDYAAGSLFGRRIVHGILVSGLISRVIGTMLPGEGTIYLSQNLKFVKPVYVEDTVMAEVEILQIDTAKKRMTLKTTVTKEDGTCVLEGEALVIPPKGTV